MNRKHIHKPNHRRPGSGFSLIEVMISLVLLSGGLLGAAYMQTFSVQYGQESYHRSQTMVSASQLMEGMRAMQVAADDTAGNRSQYTAAVSTSEAAAGCDPTLSTPRGDLICFQEEVARSLPYGTATVAINAADNRYFDITVYWADRGLSEQAGFSEAATDDTSVNLNNEADCNAAENRVWSSDGNLLWPFSGNPGPTTDICLVSHSWSVQVLDTSSL